MNDKKPLGKMIRIFHHPQDGDTAILVGAEFVILLKRKGDKTHAGLIPLLGAFNERQAIKHVKGKGFTWQCTLNLRRAVLQERSKLYATMKGEELRRSVFYDYLLDVLDNGFDFGSVIGGALRLDDDKWDETVDV
jgi:hypothetical protein